MNDTYKGESLQKKQARFITHGLAKEWLSRHCRGSWEKGLHFTLASREGGDIGVLNGLGVPYENIVAADRCKSAIDECYRKWDTKLDGITRSGPQLVHCEDAGLELAWIHECLRRARGDARALDCGEGAGCWVGNWAKTGGYPWVVSVFLDFCAHLDKSTVDCMTSAWRVLNYGTVLSVAVLKGREKVQRPTKMIAAPKLNRRARRAAISRLGASDHRVLIQRMARGEIEWDMRAALRAVEADTGRSHPAHKRCIFANQALSACDQMAVPKPLTIVEYQSRTPDSNGVPMLILSFVKQRPARRTFAHPAHHRITDAGALEWRNNVLREYPSHKAANLLNMEKPTAAALKAHVSRGTYDKAS